MADSKPVTIEERLIALNNELAAIKNTLELIDYRLGLLSDHTHHSSTGEVVVKLREV
jgi:hypothetical protein